MQPKMTQAQSRAFALAAMALLTLPVLGVIDLHVSAQTAGGNLQVWDRNPPLVRFVLNDAPYGTPPIACTTAGQAQRNTYRVVTFPDFGTGTGVQNLTKVVFKAERENRAFIQWLPAPASASFHKDFTDPDPVFKNITYLPGGPYNVRDATNAVVTRIRPDQLIFTEGSMDHGGSFRLAFSVMGNPPAGTIFNVTVEAFYANGLDGWRTNGTAYGKLIDRSAPNNNTHAVTDDATCGVGGARNLEIRIDNTDPSVMTSNVAQGVLGAVAFDADNNGHLDHLRLVFTESLDVKSTTADLFKMFRRVGSTTRLYTPLALEWETNPLTGLQNHDTINITLAERPEYDTGDMPEVELNTGKLLFDPAGNSRTSIRVRDVVDRARPVLVSAFAYEGARDLVLKFSEPVFGSGNYSDPGCTPEDPAKPYPRGAVMKCNLVYEDGRVGTNPASAVDNCVRSPDSQLTEFIESPSAPGSTTVVFPLLQGAGTVGTRTGFCNLDVNFTAGYFDSIKPAEGVINVNPPAGRDGVLGTWDDDNRPRIRTLYDRVGNRIYSPPDCQYTNGERLVVSGHPIHHDLSVKGPTHYEGPCPNTSGYAVPVTPPRVNWVEVDNDHNFAVIHLSGPVSNLTGTTKPLEAISFDVVSATGGGVGGVRSVVHTPGTDQVFLTLDGAVNPIDVSGNPSKIRIRCDPRYGAPWSYILGNGLPGNTLGVHSGNLMQDGRPVPPQVTVPCGDYDMIDRTAPRVDYANTTDLNHDGYIDGMRLVFSEPVDDASFCGGHNPTIGGCPAQVFSGILSLNGPPTDRREVEVNRGIDPLTNFTYVTGEKDNDRIGFVKFPQDFAPGRRNRLYTDAVPDLVTTSTGHLFTDLVDPLRGGNLMEPIGMFDLIERDGAGPHPIKAESLDTLITEAPWNQLQEGDGYIDSYRVTFTEAVRDSSFTACEWRVAGHNVTGRNSYTAGDADATHPGYILENDNQVIVLFDSVKTIDDDGDTDAKPEMTYILGGATCPPTLRPTGFKDLFNNAMDDVVEADVEEADTAAPSLVRVTAYSGDRQAVAVFSEPVDNGKGKHLVWRDFMYANKNAKDVAGQAPGRDANQNTREAIEKSIQTGNPPPEPRPGTQYVLLPLDDALTGPGSGGDIGSDLVNIDLFKAREVSPSVPPAKRQWADNVPHYVGIAPDITAPGIISDLGVNGQSVGPTGYAGACAAGSATGRVQANAVWLQWTAPGDDGFAGGPVASYELKVSKSDITPETFASINNSDAKAPDNDVVVKYFNVVSAEQTGASAIVGPNAIQGATITGLAPVTTYYFAVRAYDDAGNPSPMSNSCSALTTQDTTPPVGVLKVTSPTHPNEGETSSETRVVLRWNLLKDPESLVVYRYAINQNPTYQVLSTDTQTTGPAPGSNQLYAEAVYPSLLNGTWTFHVAAYSGGGATNTAHYKLLIGPSEISPEAIAEANDAIDFKGVRRGGLNTISWTLPAFDELPDAPLEAIEIWRKDGGVPTKLHTRTGTYAQLRTGNYTDPTPTASPESEYRVDMVFAGLDGPQAEPQGTEGFKAVELQGGESTATWLLVVLAIALGLLVAGAVIFFVLRARQKKAAREGAVPYRWTATGEVVLDPVTGLPIHDVKCPNCGVDFQAQGELPLQITCPSCSVSGVLN